MVKQLLSACCRALVEVESFTMSDGMETEMYTCKQCLTACSTIFGTLSAATKATQTPAETEVASFYRAYYPPTRSFLKEGSLSLDRTFTMSTEDGGLPLSNVHIDFFTGRYAEDGTPVYNHDVVEIATPNEYGSMTLEKGMINYDPFSMCYFITSSTEDTMMPTQIMKVIGHHHD